MNRFNSDPEHVIYACWDGRELRRQVIDPLHSISLPQIPFAPDASPIVLVRYQLLRQVTDGWTAYTTLPTSADWVFDSGKDSFAIDRVGNIFLVYLDLATNRVVLCNSRKDSWSVKAISHFRDGSPPDFCTLRLGPNGEPVVVVGCTNEPYGWVRVLRRKE